MNKFSLSQIISLPYFASILRISLGLIFILSGTLKFLDLHNFLSSLKNFNLINESLIYTVTLLIPLIEIIFGLLLCLKIKPILLTQLSGLLLVLFTAVIVSKIIEGEKINCGCFGNLTESTIDYTTVLRNITFIIINVVLTAYYIHEKNVVCTEKINDPSVTKSKLSKQIFQNIKYSIIYFIFFFLSTQVIILSFQNRTLKERLSILIQNKELLKEGDYVKPISVYNINGEKETILKKDESKTVVFLFSTKCSSCSLNFPIWNKLYDTLVTLNIETIAISTDTVTEQFITKVKSRFKFSSVANKNEFKNIFKSASTPQTILIDGNQKVLGCWIGVLNIYQVYALIKRF